MAYKDPLYGANIQANKYYKYTNARPGKNPCQPRRPPTRIFDVTYLRFDAVCNTRKSYIGL